MRAARSSSETQFGYLQRATDTNTSWELARFEICAHRFLHVEEPGYGVALVNDSTYGHDVTRAVREDGGTTTTVRLSLLRAPRFPDPETDQGRHRLRYALVVGSDLLDATREGHRLNLPPRTLPGDATVAPLVSVDHDGIVVSAVKLADDAGAAPAATWWSASTRRSAPARPGTWTSASPSRPSPRPTCSSGRSTTAPSRSSTAASPSRSARSRS